MKSLSPQQNFVTAISHAKSNQFEFVQFVVGKNSVAETKIFTKNSPIHEAICRCNMSPNLPPDLYTKSVLSL